MISHDSLFQIILTMTHREKCILHLDLVYPHHPPSLSYTCETETLYCGSYYTADAL